MQPAVQPVRTAATGGAADAILPSAMAGDLETIQAVLHGEVDRYAELVDRYQDQALRLAFSLLGHYEDARDVSQEAFVSAYQSLRGFRGRAKFSTWLYRIIINKCKDAYKRRARRPMVVANVGEPGPDPSGGYDLFVVDVDDPGADPSAHVSNRELSRSLSEAIGALPGKQRTAFVLHHVHGLSLEEVATVMRCRPGTVKSHVFRATEHLRSALAPWQESEGR